MAKFTIPKLAQILSVLDDSVFTRTGFLIVQQGEGNLHTDIVLYLASKDVQAANFAVRSSKPDVSQFIITMSPGDTLDSETVVVDFGRLLSAVRSWTARVSALLFKGDPLASQMERLAANLEQQLEDHLGDGVSHMTDEERAKIFAQLDELEEKMRTLLKADKDKSKQIEELHGLVMELKECADVLPKKSFFRTMLSRLSFYGYKAASSPAGQQLLEGEVEKLLGWKS